MPTVSILDDTAWFDNSNSSSTTFLSAPSADWSQIMRYWELQLSKVPNLDSSAIFSDDEYGLLNTAKFVMHEQAWYANYTTAIAEASEAGVQYELLNHSGLLNKATVISQSPSPYSIWTVVSLAIIMTAMMIVIVVGNLLVVIAIATENNLANVQNWFIASLAVADMLIGLVIMPFSLSKELMGYWMFGIIWCEVHAASDVFLCTASILNICLISLDRYWSITRAIDYLNSRTPTMVGTLIVAVWALSGLVSIPPLLGWKQDVDLEWFWELLSHQGNRTKIEFIRDLELSGQMDLENFTATLETVVYPNCMVSHSI